MDTIPLVKVELILEISFSTFGQVQYSDENGRPWIKEFVGDKWSVEIFLKEQKYIKFSVFVSNQFLQKGKTVKLVKKVDNVIVEQKEFQIFGDKIFEGWFKLG
jgi:hypothetical protein